MNKKVEKLQVLVYQKRGRWYWRLLAATENLILAECGRGFRTERGARMGFFNLRAQMRSEKAVEWLE